MDEPRRDIGFWVALLGGAYLTYNGGSALLTRAAYTGKGGALRGEDAMIYGWVVLIVGVFLLIYALVRGVSNRPR